MNVTPNEKVALVTGAGQGFGRAIAQAVAARGEIAAVADVSRQDEVETMVAGIVESSGRLDILANCARVEPPRPEFVSREEWWDRVLAVDLKGAYLCAMAAWEFMELQQYGRVINLSSTQAVAGRRGQSRGRLDRLQLRQGGYAGAAPVTGPARHAAGDHGQHRGAGLHQNRGHDGPLRTRKITGTDVGAYKKTSGTPLLPLNCLKYHSVWVAHTEKQPGYEDQRISFQEQDVIDDIHFSFGTGKSLLEFFIDPKLMTPKAWDVLAETARWCRENADVLVDTHWVGGDPEQLQVYGFASWSRRKGIVSVRNSSAKPASWAVDLGKTFELPRGAVTRFTMDRLWEPKKPGKPITLEAGQSHTFELAPFEVLAFEAIPEK